MVCLLRDPYAVTISFERRNIQDTDVAPRELYRLTEPGGGVVSGELSHPTRPRSARHTRST